MVMADVRWKIEAAFSNPFAALFIMESVICRIVLGDVDDISLLVF